MNIQSEIVDDDVPKKDREVRFEPPWETKIGQLQQVVRALHRHTEILLENRGSVIVRCYPYKSSTYMHLVYNLIYATLASTGRQYGGPSQAPIEIRAILLNYDDNGMPNPIHQPAAPFGIPQFSHQPAWTDVVLVRVRFVNQEPAFNFLQSFNRTVGRVFDRRQVRAPFAHSDLTQPERILRYRLQQYCQEHNRNVAYTQYKKFNDKDRFNQPQRQQFRNQYNYRNSGRSSNEVRYFHNGMQMYKGYTNGQNEPLSLEPYTELQCLHVIVASLRKYATLFKQKESFVIIQNIDEELTENHPNESDIERISVFVHNIINTETFQQRCQALQENNYISTNEIRQQQASDVLRPSSNMTKQTAIASDFLPMRIERISRHETNSTINGTQESKHEEKENSSINSKKQQLSTNGDNCKKKNTRPRLVRMQFRNKAVAQAFCQIFREFQKTEGLKDETNKQRNYEHEQHSEKSGTGDSYSDLSELEVRNDAVEKKQDNKSNEELQKHLFFPNAFAHRDLTPPELALGYALRQFCRAKNGLGDEARNNGISKTAEKQELEQAINNISIGGRFYTRAGRIFERSVTVTESIKK